MVPCELGLRVFLEACPHNVIFIKNHVPTKSQHEKIYSIFIYGGTLLLALEQYLRNR